MSGRRTTWRVTGMVCPHCEATIGRAVGALPGIREAKADFKRGTLTALWDPALTSQEQLRAALDAEGYTLASAPRLWLELLKLAGLLAAFALAYVLLSRCGIMAWFGRFPLARAGMGYGALLALGAMTSIHCVAMCGGIAYAQTARSAQGGRGYLAAGLLYNLGRVVSYTLTGCLIGALGSVISFSDGARATVQLLAAFFMLAMAVSLSGAFAAAGQLSLRLPGGLGRRLSALAAGRSALLVGLVNGFMPCGPLQSMQLFALSAGSWWQGGLSMLCFALGTVPLMLGFGLLGGHLNQRFGKPMRLVSAALLLVMSMSMLSNGLSLLGIGVPQVPAVTASDAQPLIADGVAVVSPDGTSQQVCTELDWGSYQPVTVVAGIPVTWNLHAEEEKLTGCNNEIVIPALNLHVPLQSGDNLITFTPQEPGVMAYTCWMGMIRSTITVVAQE